MGYRTYRKSGGKTLNQLVKAFREHGYDPKILAEESLRAISPETSALYTYIIVPEIIYWEDRATSWWNHFPDRLILDLAIYDGRTRELLNVVELDCTGPRLLPLNRLIYDPQDLVYEGVSLYLDRMRDGIR